MIKLVVFDWAGTTIDFGCFAPVAAFIESFAQVGVSVTPAQARVPMGLHKRDHIVAMLRLSEVTAEWQRVKGRDWTNDDVDRLFDGFIPLQMSVIDRHSQLISGVLEAVGELRAMGIKIGSTTGYFREAAERVRSAATNAGYTPDCSIIPEDVSAGRPYPWMIYRIMEMLNIYPPTSVVKIGDTIPDIEEGRNAGVWSLGVTTTGSEVGLTPTEWNTLSAKDQQTKRVAAETKLRNAGAHAIMESIAELPAWIRQHNESSR